MIMSNGTSRDWHPILLEPATLVIVETVPALIWAVIIDFLLYCVFSFISGKKDNVPENRERETIWKNYQLKSLTRFSLKSMLWKRKKWWRMSMVRLYTENQ